MPELDTSENYLPFQGVFFSVLASKLLFVVFKIYFEQSSMDIFLIDWERPKFQEQRFQGEDEEKNRSKYDVNAWRSLFLLNELNEL